jgi:hypothetical protein
LSVMPRDPLQPNLVQIGVHMGWGSASEAVKEVCGTYLLEGFQMPWS